MAIVKILPVSSNKHFFTLIDYIQQINKIGNNAIITTNNCQNLTIFEDFKNIKKFYKKEDKIIAHQLVQSFEEDISVEMAHQLGKELAEQTLQGYQYIITTHKDSNKIHNHIVFNSVNYIDGRKYKGNLSSLAIIRSASDNICKKYNLSIIEEKSGYKALDKNTYEIAKQGKSWKVKLCVDIDNVLKEVTTKEDFINKLEKKGYKIKWANSNIVFYPPSTEKCIRSNTLAKTFGVQYTKQEIEKVLGINIDKPIQLNAQFLRDVKAEDKNSEFSKFEKKHFKDKRKKLTEKRKVKFNPYKIYALSNPQNLFMYLFKRIFYYGTFSYKPYIKPYKEIYRHNTKPLYKTFGNITYKKLISVYGENTTIKIEPSDLHLLKDFDLFYSGIVKDNGDILLSFKTNNKDKVKKILGKELNIPKQKYETMQEKFKYKEIKNMAEQENKQLYKYDLSVEEVKKIENNNIVFSSFRKNEIHTVLFFEDDLERVCFFLQKDYKKELAKFENIKYKRNYYEIKEMANKNNLKIEYRVIDENGLNKLKDSNLKFSYVEKKNQKNFYNVSFLEKDKEKYNEVFARDIQKETQNITKGKRL